MPYIGQSPASKLLTASDITDGVISTAKLADSSVSTAKLADDSVGNTKLDLSADFAFTGTVTGAGSRLNLLNTTNASSASSVIFNSSLITSTYDQYFITCPAVNVLTNATDLNLFISTDNGSSTQGTNYHGTQFSQATAVPSSNTYQMNSNATHFTVLQSVYYSSSNLKSSSHVLNIFITMNYTASNQGLRVRVHTQNHHSNGEEVSHLMSGFTGTDSTVNYLKLQPASGNLTGTFKLYGVS